MVSVKKLFDYEMFLPISTIIHFRTLSTMIASVEMFNGKRLQARQANKGNGNVQPYERIGMTWADIVLIHSELTEVSVVNQCLCCVYMTYILYRYTVYCSFLHYYLVRYHFLSVQYYVVHYVHICSLHMYRPRMSQPFAAALAPPQTTTPMRATTLYPPTPLPLQMGPGLSSACGPPSIRPLE